MAPRSSPPEPSTPTSAILHLQPSPAHIWQEIKWHASMDFSKSRWWNGSLLIHAEADEAEAKNSKNAPPSTEPHVKTQM
jgi:hypothetical protein